MKPTRQAFLLRLFILLWLASYQLIAQVVTGTLSGNATDPTGAVVADASVTLTNENTGAVRNATTSESGAFRFTFLSVGRYDLEINKAGFKALKITGIELDANIERGLGNLKLDLGPASESIEVSSAPPLVESQQAQVSSDITGEELHTFAGTGENQGLDFIALTLPGVAATRDNNFSNTNGVGFSVDGIRGRNNDQQVDGQNNNDNSIAGPALFMSDSDFVSEYQATTSNFGPEYGRNSGSVINIVTKSGTNRWHGTVNGEETNSVLTSLTNVEKNFDFPALTKPPRFNQEFTGGTIGGPLKKDRVFVFGGFDNQILSSTTTYPTAALTPTPTGVGQLATCYPGSASIAALTAYGPYAIGGGSPTPLNPFTAYADNAPVNNTTDPSTGMPACGYELGGIERTLPNGSHIYNWMGRIDVNATKSDSFYVRYIYQKSTFFDVPYANYASAGYPFNEPSLAQSGLIDWTHSFSNRMVNEFRIGYQRNAVQFGGNTIGNTVPFMSQLSGALTDITFTNGGLLNFGVPSLFPEGRIVNSYQLQDNVSRSIGRHQLKFGVNITNQRSPNIFLPTYNGGFSFDSWAASNPAPPAPPTPAGGFAQNSPSAVTLNVGNPEIGFREWDTFLYVGDDFKVRNNLTLNLGLTWSYLGAPGNLLHQQTVARQSGSNPLWDPTLPLSVTTAPPVGAVHDLFGPSIGFAWSPNGPLMGNGKTVLRGGYRLTYDPAYYNIYLNTAGAAPAVLGQTFTGASVSGLPAAPFGPAVRAEFESSLPLGQLDPRNSPQILTPSTLRPDKVHQWSFGVQREVAKNAAVEVRYIGNHGEDLFQAVNANPYIAGLASAFPNYVPASLSPCTPAAAAVPSAIGRVNCNQGIVLEVQNGGYSNYNGLQAEFRSTNIFNQLTLRTNFTWSKTLDNTSEIFNTFAGGNSESYAQNPLNLKGGEYGLSGLDFPHTWSLSFVEDIPFMRAQNGVLGHILGGWSLSGTYILQSGQNFTPTQQVVNAFSSPVEDVNFNLALNNGNPDVVRPFVGNKSAPASQVGIFAGDACAASPVFTPWAPACGVSASTLISVNSLNTTGTVVPVNNNQVRLIANGGEAESIFGVPFGNAARNSLRDYRTNMGNLTLFKTIKFKERASLQWHMTMDNVFNHPNYGNVIPGIVPFVELAGDGAFTGFADPKVVSDATLSCPGGTRCIFFGLKVTY